jgi:TPR repeat protein
LCDIGDLKACSELGSLYAKGIAGERDEKLAEKQWLKACKGGDATGCLRLGEWYVQRGADAAGSRYLKKACDLKSAEGCLRKGLLGDRKERLKSLQKSCELGSAEGCRYLAESYSKEGASGSKMSLLERSCELGSPQGCTRLGIDLLQKKAYKRAGKALERACDLGSGKGCFERGRMYTDAKGVRRNDADALRYFMQGCLLDHTYSCNSLGFLYENGEYMAELTHPAPRKAWYYYRKSCKLGNGSGCALLGSLYEEGKGIDQNLTEAKKLYQKACDKGVSYGCKHLEP